MQTAVQLSAILESANQQYARGASANATHALLRAAAERSNRPISFFACPGSEIKE